MPRIRTLKPEHRTHRKVGRLSDRAYRLWVGMILEADDSGRLVADAGELRALIFAYQPRVSDRDVETSLADLARLGLIRLYESEGMRLADFPSWGDHQRIDRPQKSRLPIFDESTNDRRTIDELSENVPAPLRGSEGIGKEGIGKDLPSPTPPVAPVEPSTTETPEALMERWNAHADQSRTNGRKGLCRAEDLTAERRKRAAARLKEADLAWHDEAMARLASSAFACGGGPPRKEGNAPWRASFDWYVANETNPVKAHEGRYDG